MKIRTKLLMSYLIIIALFVAAGATITYNTMKMGELQNNVAQQVLINNNAYAFQQGLDQKQFGTLMYSADEVQQGVQVMVHSAELMNQSGTYLLNALAANPALLAKFNQVTSINTNQIDTAITQIAVIYNSNATDKYQRIWDQLNGIMSATTNADTKLNELRATTQANVQNATVQSQNYASLSIMLAVGFLVAIGATSVGLSIVMGNRITGPLKKLSDIAHKVSLGDLNQRYYLKQNIDIKTGDEIDELVDAFKRMIMLSGCKRR
jgi:HAMP domain-containing protein